MKFDTRFASEYAIVGRLLLSPAMLPHIELEPNDFGEPRMQAVYEAIVDRYYSEGPDSIDPITVADHLDGRMGVDLDFLVKLTDDWSLLVNPTYHADRIREDAIERDLRKAAGEILKSPESGRSLFDLAREKLSRLTRAQRARSRPVSELTEPALAEVREARRGNPPPMLRWGMPMLDRYLGLPRGGVLMLGARPGVGKSLVAGFLRHLAADMGERILFIPTELDALEDHRRSVAQVARVDVNDWLRDYRLSEEGFQRYEKAVRHIGGKPIWFLDRTTDVRLMAAEILRLRVIEGITLVILDHIHECYDSQFVGASRTQEMESMYGVLRRACTEGHDAPPATLVIAGQLVRPKPERVAHVPTMNEFKHSGKAEEIASIALILHDPYKHDEDKPRNELLGIVDKNRYGPCGVLRFAYNRDHGHVYGIAANPGTEPRETGRPRQAQTGWQEDYD